MLREEVDLRDGFHEVRDQGPYPTCLSYATSTAHTGYKNAQYKLSAESLHYTASGGNFEEGCTMGEVKNALFNTGQPEQRHCAPITFENINDWSPPNSVKYYTSESMILDPSPGIIQEKIREERIPVLGIRMTEEFRDPSSPWVFSEGSLGPRHAVVCAGLGRYDDETVVLIRNSWGSEWADSGHAWFDNSFLENNVVQLLLVSEDD